MFAVWFQQFFYVFNLTASHLESISSEDDDVVVVVVVMEIKT